MPSEKDFDGESSYTRKP